MPNKPNIPKDGSSKTRRMPKEKKHVSAVSTEVAGLGADANCTVKEVDLTQLMLACLGGLLDEVRKRADEVKVNTPFKLQHSYFTTKKTMSAIHYASYAGHLPIVKTLIEEFGADPTEPDNRGTTPVMRAAAHRRWDVVNYLLTQPNVSINDCDHQGRTALMRAAYEGNDVVARWLCEAGADTKRKDRKGFTALDWAQGKTGYPEKRSLSVEFVLIDYLKGLPTPPSVIDEPYSLTF